MSTTDELQQATEAALDELRQSIELLAHEQIKMQRVILWVLKQPWERDVPNWAELVAMVEAGPKPSLKFREAVPTPPPVRDVL